MIYVEIEEGREEKKNYVKRGVVNRGNRLEDVKEEVTSSLSR